MNVSKDIYVLGDESAHICFGNVFIYEVSVWANYPQYFCKVNSQLYTSPKEIKNYCKTFYKSPNVQISCTLMAAPERWLSNNGFKLWVKPEKKTKPRKVKHE